MSNVTTISSATKKAPNSMFDLTIFAHILAYPICGNAMGDMDLMNAIDTFVHNNHNTIKQKAIVLNHMGIYIMGESLTERELRNSDAENVQEYLDAC